MLWHPLAGKNAQGPYSIGSQSPVTFRIEPPGSIHESSDSVDIPLAQLVRESDHPDPRDNDSSRTSTISSLTSVCEDQLVMDQQNAISESGEVDFKSMIRINCNALSSSDLVRFPPFQAGSISCLSCETAQLSYPSKPTPPEQWNMLVDEWNQGSDSPRRSRNTNYFHHLPTLDRSMELPPINSEQPSALELCLPKPTLPALSSLVNDDYNSHGLLGMLLYRSYLLLLTKAFHQTMDRLIQETRNRRNAEVIPPQCTT